MYSVLQHFTFDPASSTVLTQHIKEGLVPILSQTPGFVALYWFDNDDGRGAWLGVYEDRSGAEQSLAVAASFVDDCLEELVHQPYTVHGEVKAFANCGL
jgi:hypothetical protein